VEERLVDYLTHGTPGGFIGAAEAEVSHVGPDSCDGEVCAHLREQRWCSRRCPGEGDCRLISRPDRTPDIQSDCLGDCPSLATNADPGAQFFAVAIGGIGLTGEITQQAAHPVFNLLERLV
jgi:hypothetical protein